MGVMAFQIASLTIVYSIVRSGTDQRSKLHVTGLCVGNSPVSGEFPTQRASNAENDSIWWRHHVHDPSHVLFYNMYINGWFQLISDMISNLKVNLINSLVQNQIW